MSKSVLILLLVPEPSNDTAKLARQLKHFGCCVHVCGSLAEVRTVLRSASASGSATIHLPAAPPDAAGLSCPVIVMVGLGASRSSSLAGTLRLMYPQVGIVTLADMDDHAQLVLQLHSGVDMLCPCNASAELVLATVLRLQSRSRGAPAMIAQGSSADEPSGWQLVDNGWSLQAPSGLGVSLTTRERAFLRALLAAPEYKVSHPDLLQATGVHTGGVDTSVALNRLGVVVSRLRRKCSDAGFVLPLKSVYKWGYMFVTNDTPGPAVQAGPLPESRPSQSYCPGG